MIKIREYLKTGKLYCFTYKGEGLPAFEKGYDFTLWAGEPFMFLSYQGDSLRDTYTVLLGDKIERFSLGSAFRNEIDKIIIPLRHWELYLTLHEGRQKPQNSLQKAYERSQVIKIND